MLVMSDTVSTYQRRYILIQAYQHHRMADDPMTNNHLIEQTAQFARRTLAGDGSGHDWWHVYRVWQNAIHIGAGEGADLLVVQLGALLHDIADWKFNDGDMREGARVARRWLESRDVEPAIVDHVCHIVENVSFKGAGVANGMQTPEGFCVQDADRLDAIGAIGIARCFAYGGYKGREMYNPEIAPELHETFAAYSASTNHSIAHFYEKLLLLKDRMNTETARRLAAGRHAYMESFLEQFLAEWDGQR